jgi:hypothetical protein
MPAHQVPRPELQRLSDRELLESVWNPWFSDRLVVNSVTGVLYDGNGRAKELLRRAADPTSTIRGGMIVPVEYYTPDLSMFPDIGPSHEEENE